MLETRGTTLASSLFPLFIYITPISTHTQTQTQIYTQDEGGSLGVHLGGAQRGDAAPRAVALQPRPRRAQDAHAARLLLSGPGRRWRWRILLAGSAAGGAGKGAGAILSAGGAARSGPRRAAGDRLQWRGRALRGRQGRLRRRGLVPGFRAVAGGEAGARALRRLRRAALCARHGPADLPEVRRRDGWHGHAPRHDGRRGCLSFHPDVDVPGPRPRQCAPGARAVPRPHPSSRALAAARPLRAPCLLPGLPQRPAPRVRHSCLRRPAQASRRHQVPLRTGRLHLLRGNRTPVAGHVRCTRPRARHRVAPPRAGQRPAAPAPAAPHALLRQCYRPRPGVHQGGRDPVEPARGRGRADQARGGARGRCVRPVGDRLPAAGVGEGQPGGARAAHAGVGPVGGQLARHAHVRCRLRVGAPRARRAGANVRKRHGICDAGAGAGRRRLRAIRTRARVPAVLREGILRRGTIE